MTENLKIREFSAMLRAKRGETGLRDTAAEIEGVSASTLSRIEQGSLPDLDTFIRICRWLKVPPSQFIPGFDEKKNSQEQRQDVPNIVAAHLRADRTLDAKTTEALVTMIQFAFEAAKQNKLGTKQLA